MTMRNETAAKKKWSWSVSDGRDALGTVELRGTGQFVPIAQNGDVLGRYRTLSEAMASFKAARKEASDA